jgi:hypothetical protein
MVFCEPEFTFIKPGKKNNKQDDQGKHNGHDQPAQPDPVGVFLIIYFHFFSVAALS